MPEAAPMSVAASDRQICHEAKSFTTEGTQDTEGTEEEINR